MNVVFEFLSEEPIENLITSMRFKMDKAIYFGYHETIEEWKDCTAKFLNKYCEGEASVFHVQPPRYVNDRNAPKPFSSGQ